jgi:TetR/AcrR family transcriptional regulator, cholesterol catabolism regulator
MGIRSAAPSSRRRTATGNGAVRPTRADRVSQKQRQLGKVTLKLVRERGFDELSVNELAARASISVGGLYRYIKTKSDLLVFVCDEINRGLADRIKEAAWSKGSIAAKLAAAYSVYWLTCWDNAFAILLAYREWQSLPADARKRYTEQEKQTAELFRDLIRAGVVGGDFTTVDERLLAHDMIMLAQMKALKGWAFDGYDQSAIYREHLSLVFARLNAAIPPA